MTVTDLDFARIRRDARKDTPAPVPEPSPPDPRVTEIDAALASGRYLQYAELLTAERSRLLADTARKILAA